MIGREFHKTVDESPPEPYTGLLRSFALLQFGAFVLGLLGSAVAALTAL